jgi:hypothetical protein
MRAREIISSVANSSDGDYSLAFKMLGFLLFLAEEGPESFLSGEILSPRTYHRWVEQLRRAGLEGFALDARMRQLISEYIFSRFAGIPIPQARKKVLEAVGSMVGEFEAFPLQAESRQVSEAVKGEPSETGGLEAKTRALDGGANGGSLSMQKRRRIGNVTPPCNTGVQCTGSCF